MLSGRHRNRHTKEPEQAVSKTAQWRYDLDPSIAPEGAVPPTGICGAWPLDRTGEIAGDYVPNPDYVASPIALMLAADADPFSTAWAEHERGELSDAEFGDVIRSTQWCIEVDAVDEPSVFDEGDGRHIRAFSSLRHRTAFGEVRTVPVSGATLFDLAAAGITIDANPSECARAEFPPAFFAAFPSAA
jgi:hypothetical protein